MQVSHINLMFIYLFKNRYTKGFRDFSDICAEKDTWSWLKRNPKVNTQNSGCGVGMLCPPTQWQATAGCAGQLPAN